MSAGSDGDDKVEEAVKVKDKKKRKSGN
jgi:hypothetical protein